MFNVNKATLLGRLTEDPKVKKLASGRSVATFCLATNRSVLAGKDKERKDIAEYHNMVAWGKLADVSERYLRKGEPVYLEGRIQTRSWDNAEKGKQYKTEIVVDNIIFLGAKNPMKSTEEDIIMEDIPFNE